MGRKKKIKDEILVEAIRGSHGFVTIISQRLHVNWHAADKAIKESPAAQEAMREEEEVTLDFVEGRAIERIKDGDGTMIRFYLATKGKKRGYTYEDRLEPDAGNEDSTINIICDGGEVEPVKDEPEHA